MIFMKVRSCNTRHVTQNTIKFIMIAFLVLHGTWYMVHVQASEFQIISPAISIDSALNSQNSSLLEKRIGKAQASLVLTGNAYVEHEKGSSCSYLQKPDTLVFGSNSGVEVQKISVGVKSGLNGSALLEVMEKSSLKLVLGNTILPETKCDESKQCTSLVAQKWTNPNSYGWGVHVESTYAPADFINENTFRPFSKVLPRKILSGSGNGPVEGILEIKVNKTAGLGGSYSGKLELTASCDN